MKNICILVGLSILLLSCKHSSDPEPEPEQVIDPIVATWAMKTVQLDAVFVTNYYKDLKVTFTADGKYTVQNAVPPVWKASGTYVLGNKTVTCDAGTAMDVVNISATALTLQFNYKADGARVTSVSGKYIFEFTHQ